MANAETYKVHDPLQHTGDLANGRNFVPSNFRPGLGGEKPVIGALYSRDHDV